MSAKRKSATLEQDVGAGLRRPRGNTPRLGEILVKAGVVDEDTIDDLIKQQASTGTGRLGSLLIAQKLCTHEQIREALRQQMDVEVVDSDSLEALHPEVANLLPLSVVRRYEVIPLRREGERLWVVMLDPYNLAAIDDIRFITGFSQITVAACVEADFKRYIQDHLDTNSLFDEIMEGEDFFKKALKYVGGSTPGEELEELEAGSEGVHELVLASNQSPIITLCDFMLVEAIRQQASDIHIEPQETYFRVRVRVDGRLRTLMTPPKRLELPTVGRFKVISNLDITKRRVTQDGTLAVAYSDTKVHFRVSTLPTAFGEKMVLRVLRKEHKLSGLEDVGLDAPGTELLRRALAVPQGLILVTGPTGSGKTTTVHAALRHINTGDLNIVTLEDPVEMTIEGVSHVPIKEVGGVTFSAGLRSVLRQDPDVVFVGEMRDPEVAGIAMRASLTGHLVLSTLHTNSAVESLVRLEDMGTPPYLVAGALLIIIAQRLVRTVCENCAEPYEPPDDELTAMGIDKALTKGATFRRGTGCRRCTETGYFGRAGVFEILKVDGEIRRLIRQRATPEQVLECAVGSGMTTLFDAALAHALRGETTLEEVSRVSYAFT